MRINRVGLRAPRMGQSRAWLSMTALVVAALSLSATQAAAATSSGGTIVYQVHPIARLALATNSAPSSFPYTPSQCVTTFGLACYGPGQIRAAYDVPSTLNGTGQTIVIVDAYGSPTVRQDLATYDATFKLPPPPALNIICPLGCPAFSPNQGGAQGPRAGNEVGWAEETSLDVQMSHAMAPAATIDLVVAPNSNGDALNAVEEYAVSHHLGNVMSMSFGIAEGLLHGNNGQVLQAEAIYQQAAKAGISVFASAGDSGATNGLSLPNASFPASDPLVTSVGGTDLFASDAGAYQSETVWNDAAPTLCPFGCTIGEFGATGGAPSALFSAPGYQLADNSGFTSRTTADVSFNASVYTSTLIYLGFLGNNSGFYFFGGTSEGSPSWAAIGALADQAAAADPALAPGFTFGQLNPWLYGLAGNPSTYAESFHNVTVGNNAFPSGVASPTTGYSAGPGYNLPTGLGTPDVANLVANLVTEAAG